MAKTLDEVEEKLSTGKPWFNPEPAETSAAVALVLREVDADLEALFIRRADFEGDPWSGHLAFPGGRIDPGDLGPREAAERESAEELALDLRSARLLGRLSDVMGHAESICVSAFVYGIAGKPVLTPNYEIREAFWTPLEHCTDASRQEIREFSYLEKSRSLPTIRLLNDERAPVLWGITYKFMDEFMSRIERPIPFMPWIEEDL